MTRNCGTIKTLVGEAVNSDSPEATKERYPQHTGITIVAYRFTISTSGCTKRADHRRHPLSVASFSFNTASLLKESVQ